MNSETKEIYSEIYSILNLLGKDYIAKLPTSLFNMIDEERKHDYTPTYNLQTSLIEQNVKKESIAMLALFHLNYWCKDEEEKEKLKKLFKDNEEKHQVELREKYNPDNIFKKKNNIDIKNENKVTKEDTSMTVYKENIFKRFISKILTIFKEKSQK